MTERSACIDESRIESFLSQAIEAGIDEQPFTPNPSLPAWLSEFHAPYRYKRTSHDVERAFLDALREEHSLRVYDKGYVATADGVSQADLRTLLRWLLWRAERKGPRRATKDLSRFLALARTPGYRVLALDGIEPPSPIWFGRGVALVPIAWLPDSLPKRSLQTQRHIPIVGQLQWTARAALIGRERVSPQAYPTAPSELSVDGRGVQARLNEILRWLTLVGPSAPVAVASWWQPACWVPFGTVESWHGMSLGGMPPSNIYAFSETDRLLAKRVVSLLSRLRADHLVRFAIPLERLNSAIRQPTQEGSAIDIGTALESLLLSDNENSQGELRFRTALRGAWLVGRNTDERIQLHRLLSQVYDLRSSAVHTGAIRSAAKGATDRLREAYTVTAKICLCLAQRGGVITEPHEWQRLVLGGEQVVVPS